MFVNVNTFNCSKRLLSSSSFLVTRYLPLIKFSIFLFAQDKAPLQVNAEHSESTDDKGKRNIIVSHRK